MSSTQTQIYITMLRYMFDPPNNIRYTKSHFTHGISLAPPNAMGIFLQKRFYPLDRISKSRRRDRIPSYMVQETL